MDTGSLRHVHVRDHGTWIAAALALAFVSSVAADHSPAPSSVTVAGSLQSELGCPGDWQPDCAATHLGFDAGDGVWQGVFAIPAGDWEYKGAINDSWDENYGANAIENGPNIGLSLGAPTDVKFYYDHETHWLTDNINSVIATAVGSFQSELGCTDDWQPNCLRSWLKDPDGDGVFTFSVILPGGDYDALVAIGETFSESYGFGGVPGGPNIPFTVPSGGAEMQFVYDSGSHVLTIEVGSLAPPSSVTIAGSLQSELGCPGDWQPDCAATHLGFDAEDGVWQGVFALPAGDWEYKGAINDSWDENYGANAIENGPNIGLSLRTPGDVKFYYDDETHWLTDDVNSIIATAVGSFQSELGCAGDWRPGCLRSWLQDPDGDGVFSFSAFLPTGGYDALAAIGETFDESYGLGGVPSGPNIPFTVPSGGAEMRFVYDSVSHILTIGPADQTDGDGDGVPDDEDVCAGGDDTMDVDGDGVPDFCDACPLDAANDSDGDGVCDGDDLCLGNDASGDADGDGSCNDADPCFGISNVDADGDGFCDEGDLCYGDDATGNTDGDAVCDDLDACDGDDDTGDTDGDLSCDDVDTCPLDAENDGDGDGFCESDDNCPGVANGDQGDQDGDGAGDACDSDIDGDGVPNDADNCFLDVNPDQTDADQDGVGDACDADSDGDGVIDADDVCLGTPSGDPVLENGCGLEQACPCEGNWKNHGAYEKCVSQTLKDLRKAATISAQEARNLRAASKNNECGKTGRGRPHNDDGDDDFENEDDHECRDKGHRHGKSRDRP